MREVFAKRRINSKTYRLPNASDGRGRYKLSMRGSPMHYMHKGKLVDCDMTPRWDRGDYLFDKSPVTSRIKVGQPAYRCATSRGVVAVELIDVGGAPPALSDATHVDKALWWYGVAKDTDYKIVPFVSGVTTECVLKSADAPRTWAWDVQGEKALVKDIVGRDAEGHRCEILSEYVGDKLIATWTGRMSDRNRLRNPAKPNYTEDVTYPVYIDPTVNEIITTGSDDAESAITIFTSDTELAIGVVGGIIPIYGGFRFQTLAIPQGATINSAVLTFDITSVVGSPAFRIYGDDKDDVPTWSESDRMRNITKTSAFVAATPTTTTNDYTLNVQGIVDEIIQRTGWSSGHDMRFAAFDQLASGTQVALVAALEHATNTAARLDIEYTVVAGGGIMFPF